MSSQYAGDEEFPIDYSIPSDGDEHKAAAYNVAFTALGDRTAWLKSHRTIGVYENTQYNGSLDVTSGFSSFSDVPGVFNSANSGGDVDVPNVRVGDVLVYDVSFQAYAETAATHQFRLLLTQDFGGGGAVDSEMVNRIYTKGWPVGVSEFWVPCSMTGKIVATVAGAARLSLQGKSIGGAGLDLWVVNPLRMRVMHVRI